MANISLNRNCFSVTWIYCIAILSSHYVYAKPKSQTLPVLTCESITSDLVFLIRPSERSISLTMKKSQYNLPFQRSWVNSEGIRWKRFSNNEIAINTTYPYDKYFYVETVSFSEKPVLIGLTFCTKSDLFGGVR